MSMSCFTRIRRLVPLTAVSFAAATAEIRLLAARRTCGLRSDDVCIVALRAPRDVSGFRVVLASTSTVTLGRSHVTLRDPAAVIWRGRT